MVAAEAEAEAEGGDAEAAHRQMWKKVEHGGMGGGGEA